MKPGGPILFCGPVQAAETPSFDAYHGFDCYNIPQIRSERCVIWHCLYVSRSQTSIPLRSCRVHTMLVWNIRFDELEGISDMKAWFQAR
jgi:hypothetical protein